MIVFLQALSVIVVALLFSTVVGAAVGTVLQERRRGFVLSHERRTPEPPRVRVLEDDS